MDKLQFLVLISYSIDSRAAVIVASLVRYRDSGLLPTRSRSRLGEERALGLQPRPHKSTVNARCMQSVYTCIDDC